MLSKAFKKSLDSKHNEIEQIYVDGVVEGFSPVSLGDSVENPACDLRRGTKGVEDSLHRRSQTVDTSARVHLTHNFG